MMNADELEWSSEEDNESRYLMKSPIRDDDFELPDQDNETYGGSNLIDHKRSKVFSGYISLKRKEERGAKLLAEDDSSSAAFVRSHLTVVEKLGANAAYSLWAICCSELNMSQKTELLSVMRLRSEILVRWMEINFAFDRSKWVKALEQFEQDDFLSYSTVADLIVATFGKCLDVELASPPKVSRPSCFCTYPACLQQRYEETVTCISCSQPASGDEETGLDAQLRFRLQVLFERLRAEKHGKLRVRHVLPILDELHVPYDRRRLPKALWDYRGDFLLTSAEQLEQLVARLRVEEVQRVDPLEHLFLYPLPVWLKEEFKASEILLYQHHFSMIDVDQGGSIDAAELQGLFNSLGTTLSLAQAQALIDEYDIDGGGTIDFVEFLVLIYKVRRGAIDLQDNGIARVLNEAKAQLKIFEEIEEVNLHPPDGCAVRSFGGSPVTCEFDVQVLGVGEEAGFFVRVKVTFRQGHPYFCPGVEVLTRVACPNVLMLLDGRGRVLHLEEVWSAAWSLRQLAEHLHALLASPDLSLLPDKFAAIVQDWQRGVAEWQEKQKQAQKQLEEEKERAEKEKAAAAAEAQESPGEGEDAAPHIPEDATPQGGVAAETSAERPKEEEEQQQQQQQQQQPGPPVDADPPAGEKDGKDAPPLSLEAISSPATIGRIQAMSRVEQLHVSQLFLFVTDPAAHRTFALQLLQRYARRISDEAS